MASLAKLCGAFECKFVVKQSVDERVAENS